MADILTKDVTGGLIPAEVGEVLERLKAGEPVQYVLGETTFCGHRIEVSPGVLIPRPETEWLATHPFSPPMGEGAPLHILDLCTGSGCIALALKKKFPAAHVEAWDVSPDALHISHRNFANHGLAITTRQVDILKFHPLTPPTQSEEHKPLHAATPLGWESGARASLIVSNPPYVLESERATMEKHVLHHEPGLALFVPDSDPLLFYRALSGIGQSLLLAGGELRVECNAAYVDAVAHLFQSAGYVDVQTHSDCFGMPRFVNCKRQNHD